MPRAVDPSLFGQQLPIDYSPLNRIATQVRKPPLELGDLLEGAKRFIEDFLFPAIEELTGIDLSLFLPLLDLLDLDFSSPVAFFESLINAVLLLPEIVLTLIQTFIDQLINLPETFATLVSGIVELLVSLPSLLTDLLTGLLTELASLTGVDLTAFLPLWQDLDFSNPIAFFTSLVAALLATGAGLLSIQSPLNALNLFNLVPTDLLSHIPMSNIGTSITNLLTDPHFLDTALADVEGWIHSLTGGFGGIGSMSVIANGTTHELLGNLIPVSEGQILPISGKAKWAGLAGSGNPIALGVTGYLTSGATAQSTIASHSTTPPTTDWLTLAGTYTVPANVTSLRTRLIVAPTATAGTVSFSDLSVTKTGGMLQNLIRGTNPGEFMPDDITHLFTGIMTNANGLLTKAGLGDFNQLVSTIGGTFGNDLIAAEQRLEDFLHSLSPLNADHINTGSILDNFVPGIGDIHDNIVAAVGNLSGTGFDITKMFEVLTGQTHAIVDAGAGIIDMFSRLSNLESKVSALPVVGGGTGSGTADAGAVGVTDTDNFERTSSSSLGSTWIQLYSSGGGTWAIPNGHDASWATSGTSDREFVCIRNNPAIPRSQTDYQRVALELSSKATRFYDALFGTYNFCGFDDVWLRISDATTSLANITGIRIRWGGDGGLTIHRFINGAGILLAGLGTGGITPPGPGAVLIGEAGVLADGAVRTFRAKIGTSIRLQVAEIGVASGLGGAYRRWGHGGRAEGHLLPLPGQESPGGAHYWNGMDQTA